MQSISSATAAPAAAATAAGPDAAAAAAAAAAPAAAALSIPASSSAVDLQAEVDAGIEEREGLVSLTSKYFDLLSKQQVRESHCRLSDTSQELTAGKRAA